MGNFYSSLICIPYIGPTPLKQSWLTSVFLVAALISRQQPGRKLSSASQSDLHTGKDARVFLAAPFLCVSTSSKRCMHLASEVPCGEEMSRERKRHLLNFCCKKHRCKGSKRSGNPVCSWSASVIKSAVTVSRSWDIIYEAWLWQGK